MKIRLLQALVAIIFLGLCAVAFFWSKSHNFDFQKSTAKSGFFSTQAEVTGSVAQPVAGLGRSTQLVQVNNQIMALTETGSQTVGAMTVSKGITSIIQPVPTVVSNTVGKITPVSQTVSPIYKPVTISRPIASRTTFARKIS